MLILTDTVRERPIEVGILLFAEVEVLDFVGPFEVFSVASRLAVKDHPTGHVPFNTSTIAAVKGPIVARHGLTVVPSADFLNHPPLDILIVPGGVVTVAVADSHVIDWIKATAEKSVITASVCTGAFLLAKAGLLNEKRATTHWEDIDDLRTAFPKLNIVTNVPYVDEGAIITSAGISAGIEMSLYLVERILGRPAASKTAHQMQYNWV